MRPWVAAVAMTIAAGCVAAGCVGTETGETDDSVVPSEVDPSLLVVPDFLVERTGGPTAAREFRGRPFNQSARSLSNVEFRRFGDGALVFDKHFTAAEGLGPVFNESSCLSCHLDGDEPVVAEPEQPGPGLLLRLSIPGVADNGGPVPEPTYGLQLQDRGLLAEPGRAADVPEGSIEIEWTVHTVTYPDGTTVELRRPTFSIADPSSGPLHPETLISARIAPPMTGMGLLEAIPEASLRAAADPDDKDGDGISGRVNLVWDQASGGALIGRFGWKAGQPTVLQQSAAALHDDMGITTSVFPRTCDNQGTACDPTRFDDSALDLSDERFAEQVFYNRTIAVPIARNVTEPEVIRGANTFVAVGCSSCHTTTQVTGDDAVAGLANVTFHPFTDLLLHDLGEGLADGRPEFEASGREWRTPPLWALGRRSEVTTFSSLLHDGRARTVEEAILWHGGEADGARERFMALPRWQRNDLLAFLHAL